MGTKNISKKIKNDFDIYFSKDEYGSIIHNKIISNIKNNKYTNLQLLNLIFEKDPYYTDDSKKDQRDKSILNNIDFKNENEDDIFSKFNDLKLHKIYDKKIDKYFKYFFALIKNILDFKLLFKLLNIEKIKDDALNKYIECLKDKFKEFNLNIDKKKKTI